MRMLGGLLMAADQPLVARASGDHRTAYVEFIDEFGYATIAFVVPTLTYAVEVAAAINAVGEIQPARDERRAA